MTGTWERDLDTDLKAIRTWGATTLVTLMENHELESLKVGHLGERTKAHGMTWLHLPIQDVSIPDERFERAWPAARNAILSKLDVGESVVVHCRGGLGRTGLVVGLLMTASGVPAADALRQIRAVRPGAVETTEQERYLFDT
ncbi:cyclin-dependent kinase inhibitor 3 family protein [Guyparkeria hydrothermalis]|uniref:cyclin-dependent kinase inhibitor 3 family protein n=1 Tax=Guyparkeria hydrothermalis TaxID=923 RepID=UPI002021C1E0|nr:cyclin-dependent kinase inhibitor 3 family protein [Guyparkeria hydrothermalis]MCL7744269.1 cyclin-dependent kinase inhibitor 3 family protein [Guyparkeria hydrothermalis]